MPEIRDRSAQHDQADIDRLNSRARENPRLKHTIAAFADVLARQIEERLGGRRMAGSART
jgi:hypothetical protein